MTLAATGLLVDSPSFLYAYEQGDTLAVYCSPVVRHTDPRYRPVADFLADTPHEVSFECVYDDPNMFFNQAVLTVYKLDP